MIEKSLDIISNEVRCLLLKTIFFSGSGHPGGSLSAVDMLAHLYFSEMRFDEQSPEDPQRDRFILSKGHAAAALYAVLVMRGLIPSEWLAGFRQIDAVLQGHPLVNASNWIDGTSGSLGQGFSAAIGMAKGFQLQDSPARSYVLLGDGELQEGMIWEGAMFAAHHSLSNLCAIVDYNKLQSDAPVQDIMALEPLVDKWRAFGWRVIECNGHDEADLGHAFAEARGERERPSVLIAHTIKGKGVPFMENDPAWHGALTLSETDYIAALQELGVADTELPRYLDADWWGESA